MLHRPSFGSIKPWLYPASVAQAGELNRELAVIGYFHPVPPPLALHFPSTSLLQLSSQALLTGTIKIWPFNTWAFLNPITGAVSAGPSHITH